MRGAALRSLVEQALEVTVAAIARWNNHHSVPTVRGAGGTIGAAPVK